jgi:hypothetical protein
MLRREAFSSTDTSGSARATDKCSYQSSGVPRYRLTIRRVKPDDCKALILEGVLIELDLARDLHISGRRTISVANPVVQKPGDTP